MRWLKVLLEVQERPFVDQDRQPQAGRFARRPAGTRRLPIVTGSQFIGKSQRAA